MKSSRRKAPSWLGMLTKYFLCKQLLLFLCTVIPAATSHAQQTFKLTVTSDISSSPGGFQFRHVEVATSNGLPVAKDLSIWCHVEIQNNWGKIVRVVQPIPVTLKAGEVLVEKDLYLPSEEWVSVNFSLDASSSRNRNQLLAMQSNNQGDQGHDVLVIDSAEIGESQVTFDRRKPVTQASQISSDCQKILFSTASGNRVLSISHSKIAYLPKRWIGYSSIEQFVIDKADFKALTADAERFEALSQWVTMGGALNVCDYEDDFRSIPSIKRYFRDEESGVVPEMTLHAPADKLKVERAKLERARPTSKPQMQAVQGMAAPGFPAPGFAGIEDQTNLEIEFPSGGFAANWNEVKFASGKDGGLKPDADIDVLLHRFGLGHIMFYSTPVKDLLENQEVGTYFLIAAAQPGFSSVLGTANASGSSLQKWQLMNVGIAPIGLFMFVVVSFMALIGPGGYSYLKIKRKLHYQIWMVPLISALACLSLLGYAFLSEGVGTKLRPTVFVELDQHRKVAATFGRYSVYSALQPPPYQFRDDQFATLESAGDQTPAIYRWSNDEYQLSGGNASARNVHQVFVAAPVKTNSHIEIKKSNDSEASNSFSLTNKFKDNVKLLVVKVDGELYFAVDLAADETQIRPPVADDDFAKSPDVRNVFAEFLPSNTQNYRFDRRRRYSNWGSSQNLHEWDAGVTRISSFKSAVEIRRNLEDGHYIAILDSMTEVPSVVAGAREIDGSVIVHGKW